MQFIPTLPVKAKFAVMHMLRMLSNTKNSQRYWECWAMLTLLRNAGNFGISQKQLKTLVAAMLIAMFGNTKYNAE